MVSFRKKVLDALDIKKKSVRVPVYSDFWNPSETTTSADYYTSDLNIDFGSDGKNRKPYAVSALLKKLTIGPNGQSDRLETLGFVIGDDPGSASMLPDCINREAVPSTSNETGTGSYSPDTPYTGYHMLGGLYDSKNVHLQSMRKAAVMPVDMQTHTEYDQNGNATSDTTVDHTHKDWPNTTYEQAVLLNEDPYADSLYYHHTQIRFVLTGIDDISERPAPDANPQASNHRGTVRMLVLRPRTPSIRTRVDGTSNSFSDRFKLNCAYLPNWDTQLFYDRKKQLGGRLDDGVQPHQHDNSDVIVSYGLEKREKSNPDVDTDIASIHYGHYIPSYTTGIGHNLTPLDLLMSPINKQKFAVLHDEVFTLDSLHHGAAAQHVTTVTIPYNKKVCFSGRMPDGDDPILSTDTFDEPMNMSSRPIVLFLSYNQKISAQVEGYTVISEV